ncbi:MAG: glycosyltransferase family 4 protein [Dehalococcoidia bacterium]|nr:glycosyltransferase family 4 protein [Dehalococcoidia bacterium]
MRICIYTKRLTQRLDEGIARVAHELASGLAKHHEVLTLFSLGDVVETENLVRITSNRIGLDLRLRARIRSFRPDVILYIVRGPATPAALLFGKILGSYWQAAAVAILAPQTRSLRSGWARKCAAFLNPGLILTTSTTDRTEFSRVGCPAEFVPLGVNVDAFTPATQDVKRALRHKYGLPEGQFVVLHVGHIQQGRNIGALGCLQKSDTQVLVAASTFSQANASLARQLQAQGVRFLNQYFDRVQEMYQLADVYVFPTVSEEACIGQPLSVLEAMACNLPVVSTKFGGLPDLFPVDGDGLYYADSPSDIAAKTVYVREHLSSIQPRTRELVKPYSWERTCREVSRLLSNQVARRTPAA